jgi:tetraacyldisaccharide 4'-kinase
MKRRLETIWESDEVAPSLLRAALVPFSFAFGAAARLRSSLYDKRILSVARASIPVVSIGNLRVGGVGKTPLTLWLAERVQAAGRRPAIVTRGYGGREREAPTLIVPRAMIEEAKKRLGTATTEIVGFDEARDLSPSFARGFARDLSDEARLLALRTRVPIVVAPERLDGCEIAARIGCDLALLDDAFQHRRLHRDLDIVLTSSDDARSRLLPAGPLREGVAALARADLVVATDEGAPTGGCSTFRQRQVATGLVADIGRHVALEPVSALRGREIVGVAGIARPERFLDLLAALGAKQVCVPFLFPDHHVFGAADLRDIARAAAGRYTVVTTEKDLVKLLGAAPPSLPLLGLRIDLAIDDADGLLQRVLAPLDASSSEPHHPPLARPGVETKA